MKNIRFYMMLSLIGQCSMVLAQKELHEKLIPRIAKSRINGPGNNGAPLAIAIDGNDVKEVQLLLKKGAQIMGSFDQSADEHGTHIQRAKYNLCRRVVMYRNLHHSQKLASGLKKDYLKANTILNLLKLSNNNTSR